MIFNASISSGDGFVSMLPAMNATNEQHNPAANSGTGNLILNNESTATVRVPARPARTAQRAPVPVALEYTVPPTRGTKNAPANSAAEILPIQ